MEVVEVMERVERIVAARAGAGADRSGLQAALLAERQVRAWLDAAQADLVRQVAEQASFPEAELADTTRGSIADAGRTLERSATLQATPQLAAALDSGSITAGHVDAVTRGSKLLDDRRREELFECVDRLAPVAEAVTVAEFRRRVRDEVRRFERDGGMTRLERQRRATRLSTWVDGEGMWNLRGRFDPLTGLHLAGRLDAELQARFAESTPDHCPSDPVEKQQFLAAHALAGLLDGAGGARRSGRPEVVAVVDADAPGRDGPVALWSIPVEIPTRVLAELAGDAEVHAVVVRNGVVLHAPGELNLGRSTRLANRAQRRALRGLYATCGIPGCAIAYDRCKLHHVVWWRHGGRTDLANLLPLCSHHHSRVHSDGWTVSLGPNRELILRFPDGSIQTTGPPSIRAA